MEFYKYGSRENFYVCIGIGSVVTRYDLVGEEWKEGPYPLSAAKIRAKGTFVKVENPFEKPKTEEKPKPKAKAAPKK